MNPEMYQDILNYGDSNDDCMHFSDADIKVTKVLPDHLEPPPRLKWINGTWTPWSECPNDIGIDLDEDPDEERLFSLSRIKMQYICIRRWWSLQFGIFESDDFIHAFTLTYRFILLKLLFCC